MASELPTYVLTMSCPDRIGVVADVAAFLVANDCNIIESGQFGDAENGQFFLRTAFPAPVGQEPGGARGGLRSHRREVRHQGPLLRRRAQGEDPAAGVQAGPLPQRPDLPSPYRRALPIDIVGVVSTTGTSKAWSAPPACRSTICRSPPKPSRSRKPSCRPLAENRGAELIVLARYMQVLSAEFCARWPGRVINIHHSFLPSFKGANPYQRAHARGVKLIGAHRPLCHRRPGRRADHRAGKSSA
ncbi:MAG: formyltransferase family protein [Caulobacteraceae bacterium]